MPRAFDTGTPVPLHDPNRSDLNFNIDRKFDLIEMRQVMWESMFNEIGLWFEERTGIDLLNGWEGFITSIFESINLKIEDRQLNKQEFLLRVREHNQKFLNDLYDGLMGNAEGTTADATWQDIYLVTHSARDRADEAFKSALAAKLANEMADLVTDVRAAAGTNLVLSPHFSNSTIKRFPLNDDQLSGYSVLEVAHSGVQSWKWTHINGQVCGLAMAPTPRINHFDVMPDEEYFVESWVYSSDFTPQSEGSIQVGATVSDTSGVMQDVEFFLDCPLDGTEIVAAQWNKINTIVTIPMGYDKAKFWVRSTADVAEGLEIWIDDIVVREYGPSARAERYADKIVDRKARAGSNLVIDPDFSDRTVTRFPYNNNQIFEYSRGQGSQHLSGLQSWTWTQETAADCGLILAPTEKVKDFQVSEGESYLVEAHLFPEVGYAGGAHTIRIGATLTDSAGINPPTQIYESPEPPLPPGDEQPDMPLVAGQWNHLYVTVKVPAGYDTAKFWIVATSNSPAGSQFWVDDVCLRETSAANTVMDILYDALMGLPRGTSTGINWHDVYMALSQKRDHADEAFRLAVAGEIANNFADLVTDLKSAANSNLFLSPKFSDTSVVRFPLNDTQASGYSLLEERHSGLQSWKWFHVNGIDCGITLAPTTRINHFDVSPGEEFMVEAWIFPKATNHTATGSIRIGGTFIDTAGGQQDSDIYLDFPLNGSDVLKDRWNKINIELTVPAGVDKARFWVKSTAATHDSDCFWIDDVLLREQTSGKKAERLADRANRIVNFKSSVGGNLVASPKFSNSTVERFPYNIAQLYEYAHGVGEQKHSGLQSWKWVQENNSACGLVLAPTEDVDSFEVLPEETYFVESWIFPAADGGNTGAVRIGATFSDSSGGQANSDVYYEAAINGSDMLKGQWNKVNTTLVVPEGFDTAKFWVIATAATTFGSTFWVDDVTVREGTEASKAGFIVDMRARAGANLVVSPGFSSRAVDRFPYNNAQEYSYAHGNGAEHHSGLQSWKWVQENNSACGLILAPTPKVESFDVAPDEEFFVEAYVHPSAGNSGLGGAVRIGGTFSDSSGTQPDSDIYLEFALNGPDMLKGQWNKVNHTITVPAGMDTAKFWVIATAATPSGHVFFVDDVTVKEQAAANRAQRAVDRANRIVGMKARAGANLVVSPKFSSSLVDRFPYNTNQVYEYAAGQNEQKHSGLQSWKWTQETNAACGLVLAPTEDVDTFEVNGTETFIAEAWVYPAANSGTVGSIRIGGTFSDSGGALANSDVYLDWPLSGTDMVKGQWNKVNHTIEVPAGMDTAKFWVYCTGNTTGGSVFFIDDVTTKEVGASKKAEAQADYANWVTDLKSKAGANLVIDPKFTSSLVDRFPFNTNQVYDTVMAEHHSGLVSWKWIQEASAACGFVMNPTGKVDVFQVDGGEQYLVEAWLQPGSGNANGGAARIGATFSDSNGYLTPVDLYQETALSSVTKGSWSKLSVAVTVPAGYDTAKFWVIATAATPSGSIFYLDDVAVKTYEGVAALTVANTATTNLQTVVDSVVQAVDGGSATGATHLTVRDKLKLAWANLWDGLNGSSGSTSKLPGDVKTVAAAVKSTAGTASTNATTAIGAAATADTKAVAAQSLATNLILTGSNLASNPGWENTSYWISTQASYSTDFARNGTRSCKIVATGNSYPNTAVFVGLSSELSMPCAPGDVYYMEAYVRAAEANTATTGSVYTQLAVKVGTSSSYTITYINMGSNGTPATLKGGWTKLSGYATIPAGGFEFGAYVNVHITMPAGNIFYWDDAIVRETTVASTATTNLQTVVDGAVQAIDGGSATGAAHSTFKTKLQLAWANLWDGLGGTSGATSKLPGDVKTVATALKSTATTADTNATTGIANAATADAKAVAAQAAADRAALALNTAITSGANIVFDGGFENDYLRVPATSDPYMQGARSSEQKRSGSYSWKHTANGLGIMQAQMHALGNRTSSKWLATVGRKFYIEAWVYPHSSNAHTGGYLSIQGYTFDVAGNAVTNVAVGGNYNCTSLVKGQWQKLSGVLDMTTGYTNAYNWYLYLRVDITTAAGDIFYWDDVRVVDITEAYDAKVIADAATTNLQTVVDSVVQAVDGGTATGAAHLTVRDKLRLAWANLWDGMNGSSGSTSKLPGDVKTVAAAVKSTAGTALTNAATADGKAVTAQTAADGVSSRAEAFAAGGSGNLCTNSGFEDTTQFLGDGTYSTSPVRSGSRSVKMSGNGSTQRYVQLATSKNSFLYLPGGASRSYYCEVWVYGDNANTLTGTDNHLGIGVWGYRADGSYVSSSAGVVYTNANAIGKGSWVKLSGIVTLSSSSEIAKITAALYVKIEVPAGNSWYFDDAVIREVTESQNIVDYVAQAVDGGTSTGSTHSVVKTKLQTVWSRIFDGLNNNALGTTPTPTATDLHTAGTAARGRAELGITNASTADGKAVVAQTNLQTVVDGAVQAIDGGSATGAAHSTFKTKLQLAWANLWDGLGGTTGATSKLPSDVKTVATALKSTATTADTNATTGIANAAAAQGTANTATTNLQTVVDGAVQAVDGGTATGAAHSAFKTKLQLAWARIFDGLSNQASGTTSTATGADLHTAGFAARTRAELGITNASTADGKAVVADGKAVTADGKAVTAQGTANTATTNLQTVVDGVVQAVDGGSATGATHSTTKTKLQLAWARIFDGLNNSALGTTTTATSTNMHTAGLAARGRAELGITNASTADGKAVTAQGTANTATTNLQTVVDGVVQAVDGGSATGAAHSTAKTKLQLAWARIFDGLNNSALGTTTTATSTNMHTAAIAARGRAELGVTNASTADGKAVTAQADIALRARDFTNIAVGLDFETTNPLDTAVGFTVDTAQFHSGTKSLRLDLLAAGGTQVGASYKASQMFECKAGEQFYAELWVKKSADYANTHGQDPRFRVVRGNGANVGQTVGQISLVPASIPTTNWTKLTATVTIPSDATTCSQFYLFLTGPQPGAMTGSLWIDDIVVRRVVVPDAVAALPQSKVTNLTTDLGAVQTNHGTLVDNVASAFTGQTVTGRTLADALSAMGGAHGLLGTHTRQIIELQAQKAAASTKGVGLYYDFGNYANGSLPAEFTVTYSGAGTSTIGIENGQACWRNTNNADRDAKIIHSTPTNTDFQVLRGSMEVPPQAASGGGGTPKFHAIGRVSADGLSYVWARGYCDGFLSYKGELGCTVNGTETVWASNISLSWNLDMTLVCGVGTNARQYQVWAGNTLVKEHTEVGTTSMLGSSYRKWGSIAQIKAGGAGGPNHAGKLGGASVYDNEAPTVNGSTARMHRTSTTAAAFNGGNDVTLPSSFFGSVTYESPDIDAVTSDGTFTVRDAKTYIVGARIRLDSAVIGWATLGLQVYRNSAWTNIGYGPSGSTNDNTAALTGNWVIYLNAGEKVRLTTSRDGVNTTVFVGDAAGASSFFSIVGVGI